VYEKALGKGVGAYLLRCGALLIVSAIFLALMFVFHIMMVRADKQARGIGGWLKLVKFLYFSPGALTRLLLPWLDYFRPNFHPWDHDNRELLVEVGPLSEMYAAAR
jgi:predicted metal-dependent hydrolase